MAKKMTEIGVVELRKIEGKNCVRFTRKERKRNYERLTGLSPFLKQRLRNACRDVWFRSSQARKNAAKRAELPGGFSKCEGRGHKGERKKPKTFVDHIIPIGEVDSVGFIERLGVDSNGLTNLCKDCHDVKTKADNAQPLGSSTGSPITLQNNASLSLTVTYLPMHGNTFSDTGSVTVQNLAEPPLTMAATATPANISLNSLPVSWSQFNNNGGMARCRVIQVGSI